MHQVASRHYALEARCFVLAAGLIMRVKDLPAELVSSANPTNAPEDFLLRGGSAVIGPDGRSVIEPTFEQEKIIYAELDLTAIDQERMTMDVAGHYSRPDKFEFGLRPTRARPASP